MRDRNEDTTELLAAAIERAAQARSTAYNFDRRQRALARYSALLDRMFELAIHQLEQGDDSDAEAWLIEHGYVEADC